MSLAIVDSLRVAFSRDSGVAWGTFSGQPLVRFGPGDRLATLAEDFSFLDPVTTSLYTARAGLIFDGASIPRIFWWLVGSPFTGPIRRGAVIHDQLCADARQAVARGLTAMPPREVHAILFRALRAAGTNRFRARVRWLAVTLFSRW